MDGSPRRSRPCRASQHAHRPVVQAWLSRINGGTFQNVDRGPRRGSALEPQDEQNPPAGGFSISRIIWANRLDRPPNLLLHSETGAKTDPVARP